MRKAWEITLKDLRQTFGDRNLLLIMFAAPLVLAAIIAVTFGGVMGNSAPIEHIAVAVVNLDNGASLGLAEDGGDSLNYGDMLSSLLISGTVSGQTGGLENQGAFNIGGVDTAAFSCPDAAAGGFASSDTSYLDTLIDGTSFTDADAARAAVRAGDYAAAVIIPASFSTDLQVTPLNPQLTPTTIEIYTSPVMPIAAQIARSVVEQISTQFATGNVTLSALIYSLPSNPVQVAAVVASPAFGEGVACAFAGVGADIRVERQTAAGEEVVVNALVIIGAAQAMFFALFTANGQAASIIVERRDGTLQRMLTTPTPAVMILLGKIIGVFVVVLVQLAVLVFALTVLASLIAGTPTMIWGTNLPAITLVVVAVSFATAGIGSITAAFGKTEGEANTIGGVVAIFMAVLGGAFGFQLPAGIGNLSIIRWGTGAFTELALGGTDIWTNVLVLFAFGIVTFGVGFFLFRSRISDR